MNLDVTPGILRLAISAVVAGAMTSIAAKLGLGALFLGLLFYLSLFQVEVTELPNPGTPDSRQPEKK